MHRDAGQRRAAARGFTLIEMMITVVIFVLAASVVVPAVSKSGLAELRANASKVAGTVRATYDRAALGGRSYRLAFDLDKQMIRVEVDRSRVHGGSGLAGLAAMMQAGSGGGVPTPAAALAQLGGGKGGGAGAAAGGKDGGKSGAPVEEVQPPKELLGLLGGAASGDEDAGSSGLASFQNAGHDLSLPADAHLMDVWIEGMSQPVSHGVAYLQFFPGGYTQSALVHVADNEGTVFTVKVSPLTGGTQIVDSYVEAPR